MILQVALKLIPDTKSFINLLKPKDENTETLIEDMETFISLLVPILEEIHPTLVSSSSESDVTLQGHCISVSWFVRLCLSLSHMLQTLYRLDKLKST